MSQNDRQLIALLVECAKTEDTREAREALIRAANRIADGDHLRLPRKSKET